MKIKLKETAKIFALAVAAFALPFGLTANVSARADAGAESGAQETFAITYNIGENGNVTCTHEDSAASGEEITFTVTPAAGYEVENFFINDVPMPLSEENTYTHTIYYDLNVEATFKAFEVETGSIFTDGYGNGRVDVAVTENSQTVTLANTDGQYGNTKAVYSTTVDLTTFETTFTLDQISVDGAFRLSFMQSPDNFPAETNGAGFGIYFWDETAWGYTEKTSLRTDFYTYTSAGCAISEAKALGCEAGNAWRGEKNYEGIKLYVKVWKYDNANLAIHIYGNDMYEQGGLIPMSKLPSDFDYTNCYMMITPDIDISRTHSFVKDVKLTFEAKVATPDEGGNDGAEEPTEYSITYYDGDTIIRVAYANEGDKFYNFIPPEKEGFEFDGWYLDEEFTEIFNIAAGATEDVVVYAKYVSIDSGSTGGCGSSISGVTVFGLLASMGAIGLMAAKKNKKEN